MTGAGSARATVLALVLPLLGAATAPVGQKPAARPEKTVFKVDQARSRITVHLVQEGLIAKLRPKHQVAARKFSGSVAISPVSETDVSVEIEAEAASLTNIDEDMNDFERREFHSILRDRVLESGKFPVIRFVGGSVSNVRRNGAERSFDLAGELSLHGVRRAVTVPVTVTIDGDTLNARGEARLRQTDFEIKPYSGGFGAIKIGDEVKVSFQVVAAKS